MRSKYYWLTVVPFLFILACGSDKATESDPIDDLPYLNEAQEMALIYSGELRPPDSLTRRISRELSHLREQWQDSIPAVTTTFWLPWRAGRVEMRVDDTTFTTIMSGQNKSWNDLCARFNLTYNHIYPWASGNHIGVYSVEPLHPYRLAEYFADFSGVTSINPHIVGWHPCPSIVRFDDDGESKYFIREFCRIETNFTHYYFEVERGGARLVEWFSECPPNEYSPYVNVPIDSFQIYEAVFDSIEQNRPAWVDTARYHLRLLDWYKPDDWPRPE